MSINNLLVLTVALAPLSFWVNSQPITSTPLQEDAPDAKGRRPSDIRRQFQKDSIRAVQTKEEFRKISDNFVGLALAGASDDSCIAYYQPTENCLIASRTLDSAFSQIDPKYLQGKTRQQLRNLAATAKMEVIEIILDRAFFNEFKSQQLENEIENVRFEQMEALRKRAKIADEGEKFDQLYQEFFVAFARSQEKMRFEAYVSSDSDFIRALYDDLAGKGVSWEDSMVRNNASRRQSLAEIWHPVRIPIQDVPEDWFYAAKTLRPNEWTAPLATPFGYAVFRTNRSLPTYSEMLPVLSILTGPGHSFSEAELKHRASQYYTAHLHEFIGVEALSLRLAPQPIGADAKPISPLRKGGDSLIKAAARGLKARSIRRIDLPPGVEAEIHAKPCSGDSDRFRRSVFGYQQVCSLDHNRSDTIPFAQVEALISSRLRSKLADSILANALSTVRTKEEEKALDKLKQATIRSLAGDPNLQTFERRFPSTHSEQAQMPQERRDSQMAEDAKNLLAPEDKLRMLRNDWIRKNISFAADLEFSQSPAAGQSIGDE